MVSFTEESICNITPLLHYELVLKLEFRISFLDGVEVLPRGVFGIPLDQKLAPPAIPPRSDDGVRSEQRSPVMDRGKLGDILQRSSLVWLQ